MAVGQLALERVEGAAVVESIWLQDVQVRALGAGSGVSAVARRGPCGGGRGHPGRGW